MELNHLLWINSPRYCHCTNRAINSEILIAVKLKMICILELNLIFHFLEYFSQSVLGLYESARKHKKKFTYSSGSHTKSS